MIIASFLNNGSTFINETYNWFGIYFGEDGIARQYFQEQANGTAQALQGTDEEKVFAVQFFQEVNQTIMAQPGLPTESLVPSRLTEIVAWIKSMVLNEIAKRNGTQTDL